MTMKSIPSSTNQTHEVHFQEYLGIILHRRITFLAVFCTVFFAVALFTLNLKPVYEASTTLHVRAAGGGKGELFEGMVATRQNPIDSEIEILKSRTNAEQVVKRMHLNWNVSKKSRGISFKITDFATTVPGNVYRIELTGTDSFKVAGSDNKQFGDGKSGVLFQSGELRLLLDNIKGQQGDSFRLSIAPLDDIANSLKNSVKANEVGSRTNIIRLSYSDIDPVKAKDVVNTLADVYLEQSVDIKIQEATKSVDFIEKQLNSVRGDLDNAEKNLQEYKSAVGLVKLDGEAEELVRKLSDIEKDRAKINLQKKQVDVALVSQRDALKKGKVYSPAGLKDDPGVALLATKLSDLEIQKRGLSSDLTDSHPHVKNIQGQIDEIQKKLIAIYETNQKNLAIQESAILQNMSRYEKRLKQLPQAERDLARLMRHVKVNADIYTFLLQRHESARIVKASTISNINVIDPAIEPRSPIKPNKKKNLLLGILLGAMLGVGIAFFQEYLDDTIKDPESARRDLGLPVLAVIPLIPKKDRKSSSRLGTLITQLEPKSPVSEAFRALRTGVHFSAINRNKKIILMTSTFPGEGKSTVISNLAVTLVQTGARVLLLDCDLRRPALHDVFGHSQLPGLSEILAGDSTFESVIHNTGIKGLDLISAGTTPPNPSELLGSGQMADLLVSMQQHYDHILIDAPPVLAVTDAPLLTAHCDVVLVTIETGRVPVKAVRRMIEMLVSVKAPVAGIVINDKADKSREQYGYYSYSYGDYGNDNEATRDNPWWRNLLIKLRIIAK